MAQKLLLFWRKPARRCWWEGVELENVEGVDGKLKVWIRRVWTLEMVWWNGSLWVGMLYGPDKITLKFIPNEPKVPKRIRLVEKGPKRIKFVQKGPKRVKLNVRDVPEQVVQQSRPQRLTLTFRRTDYHCVRDGCGC